MKLYKDVPPMGYSLWEEVYIDELLFVIYDLEDKNQKLQDDINALSRSKGSHDFG